MFSTYQLIDFYVKRTSGDYKSCPNQPIGEWNMEVHPFSIGDGVGEVLLRSYCLRNDNLWDSVLYLVLSQDFPKSQLKCNYLLLCIEIEIPHSHKILFLCLWRWRTVCDWNWRRRWVIDLNWIYIIFQQPVMKTNQ